MSEDTDQVEGQTDSGVRRGSQTEGRTSEDLDSAAEAFLDLESDIDGGGPSGHVRGRAVDVERLPAADVPDDYPRDVSTDEALALHLDVDGGRETVVYFEWDETVSDDPLGRLLALHDVPPERFADLHGSAIVLEPVEGYWVPVVPEESPRGSSLGVYGVWAGLGLNLLTALLVAVGLSWVVGSSPFIVLWLLVTLVGLPAATYLDSWHCRTYTDWNGGPLFWTTLAAIPGVNILSSAAYLRSRYRSSPLA